MSIVYFIKIGKFVKIGFTTQSIEKRIAQFDAGVLSKSDVLLTISGGRNDEQRFHEIFAKHRIRRELFKQDYELMEFIYFAKTHNLDAAFTWLEKHRELKIKSPLESRKFTKAINEYNYQKMIEDRIRLRTAREAVYCRVVPS